MSAAANGCPTCGAQVGPGAAFCRACGLSLRQRQVVALCPQCHHANPADSRFCRACGLPVRPDSAIPGADEPTRVDRRDRSRSPALAGSRAQPRPTARRWGAGVAALIVLLAVAGAIAAVIVIASSRHRAPHAKIASTERAASSPTKVGATKGKQAAAPVSRGSYDEGDYTAAPPSGWLIVEDAEQMPGYLESKWQSRSNPHQLVKVDMSPASGLAPAQAAAQVHADLLRERGYQEVEFGPGSLTQVSPSLEWIFKLPGSERVDWFFSECRHDFAVLGAARPGAFKALLRTFTSFADSVLGTCDS